jgi:hypothetical protein
MHFAWDDGGVLIRWQYRAALSIQIINSASSGDLPKSSY